MAKVSIRSKLAKLARPFRRMEFKSGDVGQLPVTKLGGVPWWPENIARPTCVEGHNMAFVAQFRLDDLPGLERPISLVSFHYCDRCTNDGKMPWGWEDEGRQLRYRLSIFQDVAVRVDGLGQVADSRIAPQMPTFHDGTESLGIEDIWKRFPETAVTNGISHFGLDDVFHEERSKLGGWPSWVQHPLRPKDEQGEKMRFLAQLDLHDCPESSWATGYAYLFISDAVDEDQEAEVVIQTT